MQEVVYYDEHKLEGIFRLVRAKFDNVGQHIDTLAITEWTSREHMLETIDSGDVHFTRDEALNATDYGSMYAEKFAHVMKIRFVETFWHTTGILKGGRRVDLFEDTITSPDERTWQITRAYLGQAHDDSEGFMQIFETRDEALIAAGIALAVGAA